MSSTCAAVREQSRLSGGMTRVVSRGKKRVRRILINFFLVLGACLISLEAPAQLNAPQGCAKAPASSLVVNVKDKGAKGDGRTDDTAAIQAAIDQVARNGATVLVPDGTYMVNAVGENRLTLKSDMTLKLSSDAKLKAIPNNSESYSVLYISGVSNVTVIGGTLEGEREEHSGNSGDWGMGIRIDRGAAHITISKVASKKMWGDGFYVQGATDVKFCSVTADNNRRQGLSIIEADGLVVKNSTFKNTHGTRPSDGIDLEPDTAAQRITNVRIQDSQFLDNAGAGIQIAGKKSVISNIEITRNVFRGNRAIVVKSACGNRYTTYLSEPSGGLYAFADPTEVSVHQNNCRHGRS
jgi:polygalacturonase